MYNNLPGFPKALQYFDTGRKTGSFDETVHRFITSTAWSVC